MSLVKYDFLRSIEADFHSLNERYEKLPVAFRRIDKNKPVSDADVFFEIDIPEMQRLIDKMTDWHLSREALVKGELEKELEYNLVNSNTGYFEYARNVFMKQYNYLAEQFPDLLKEYILDELKLQEHADAISNDGNNITLADFNTLYKIRCIQLFRWMEREYALAYQSYEPFIALDRELPLEPWFYIEPINLIYKDKNNEVMELLYKYLNETYIKIPKAEFFAHFSDKVPRQPIRWGDKVTTLLPLFTGQQIEVKKLEWRNIGLELDNNIPQMVVDHFSDSNGKRFKIASIRSMYSESSTKNIPKGNDNTLITKLLKAIYLLATTGE